MELVGRSEEVAALSDLVERARRGTGQAAFIEGEPGIGKTCLLQAVLVRANELGFAVLEGFAEQPWGDKAFAPLMGALGLDASLPDETRRQVAELIRTTSGQAVDNAGLRFRVLDAIVELLERWSRRGPILLAVEDLHWADPSTLLSLGAMMRHLSDLPFALVATFRPGPRQEELQRLLDNGVARGALRIALGPLDDGAVGELAAETVGAPPGPGLTRALNGAGGNPLFVTELINALIREGAIREADGRVEATEVPLPPSLRLVILRQLSLMSSDVLEVLRVASVLGTPFSVLDVCAVLSRQPSDLMTVLSDALSAKVLVEAGDRLAFRHELVRDAMYLDMPIATRTALHRQVGEKLGATGAPATIVAHHLSLAADRTDATAFEWLVRAAREAALAPEAAVGLFERALEVAPSDRSNDEIDLVAGELIEAQLWSGHLAEVEAQARALVGRLHNPRRAKHLRLTLIRALTIAGRFEDAEAEVQAAQAVIDQDDEDRARLDADAAILRISSGDLGGGRTLAEAARARAERVHNRPVLPVVDLALGYADYFAGRIDEAVESVRRAVVSDRGSADPYESYAPRFLLGTALIEADKLDEADTVLLEGQRLDDIGLAWQAAIYHGQLGLHRFVAGRWDEAVAELQSANRVREERPGGIGSVFPDALQAVIAVHCGDYDGAEAFLVETRKEMAAGVRFGIDAAIWATALWHEARGEPVDALVALESVWGPLQAMGFVSQCVRLGPDLTRLAVDARRVELGASVAETMVAAADLNPTASWRGAASLCRGLAYGESSSLADAVGAYRDSPRPLERAWAMHQAGHALAAAGDPGGIGLLEEAIGAYEGAGALGDVARAEATLRELGVRRGRRGHRRRPSVGWDSLTETERRVVELAGQGLTNVEIGRRMFISRRTVETHLSHVFSKVGVSSRVQLAAEAARRAS